MLTESSATPSERTQVKRRLEREDVDVDALLDDLVSYQAIRTYFTEYQDAKYEPERDPLDTAIGTINRLQTRMEAVVEDRRERLRDTGTVSLGEFTVIVNVQVVCEDCGQRTAVIDLLTDGSCNC